MSTIISSNFGDLMAERITSEHRALAGRWFERLLALLPVEARDVFPTESLLDHVPSLIAEIGGYVRNPEEEAIAANTTVLEKARELGALRHGQRASLHQVLKEYQVLAGVLVAFVVEEIERLDLQPSPAETVQFVNRLHQAVDVLSQSTVEAFVSLYTSTIADQNERLEQFTRMAAHEWRQPLGVLQFAVGLLRRDDVDPDTARRTFEAIDRSVTHLVDLTLKLESVARMRDEGDTLLVQEVSVRTVAEEAARQVREMAEARGVELRIGDALPVMTVDVGRLELILVNLLSNAIKYSDPAKSTRYAEILGAPSDLEGWSCFIVRDNGLGIPQRSLSIIFQRFTRAHAGRADTAQVDGVGLGLSIVDDCVRALGGRIDVQSQEGEGTTFVLTLPTSAA